MADQGNHRRESFPSLTAREHWGRYAAGMAVETGFILVLTAVGFALAVLAEMIWP